MRIKLGLVNIVLTALLASSSVLVGCGNESGNESILAVNQQNQVKRFASEAAATGAGYIPCTVASGSATAACEGYVEPDPKPAPPPPGTETDPLDGIEACASTAAGCIEANTCSRLENLYSETLQAAKRCGETPLTIEECDVQVQNHPVCGCPTFVSNQRETEIKRLDRIKKLFYALKCHHDVVCPAMPCWDWDYGSCENQTPGGGPGACVDQNN